MPTKDFLEGLKVRVEPKRPECRTVNQIDIENPYVTLMTNYHFVSQASNADGHLYTIEIKPKGCKPEKTPTKILDKLAASTNLLRDNPAVYYSLLNSTELDFNIKQVQKLLKGSEKYYTNYSPVNLFSNNKAKIMEALRDLRACPQCNLKMYQDGVRTIYLGDDLLEVIAEILTQTKVLDYIKDLLYVTDKSIEEVWNIYSKDCKDIPEAESQRIIEEVMPKCLNREERFEGIEESWAEVLRYLFSRSARDCSIMITFCPVNEKVDSKSKLEHNETLLTTKGKNYVAKVGVIDFDVKLIRKMEFYYSDKIRALSEYIEYHST